MMGENIRTLHPIKLPTQEEGEMSRRYQTTMGLRTAIDNGVFGLDMVPGFVKDIFKYECWKPRRSELGSILPETTLYGLIHDAPPAGIGSSYEQIKALMAHDTEALALFDQATERSFEDQPRAATGRFEAAVDNIHGGAPARPDGTSKLAGLRRLRKAAEAGDPKARDLYERALKGDISIHAANLEMGFRKKPTATQALQAAWRKASPEEREQFREWIDEQDAPMRQSAFR